MVDGVEGRLAPLAGGGPGPGANEGTVGVAGANSWRKRALIAAIISLLASGAMVAASFMPWLRSETGRTLSGWDIYEAQRDGGYNAFFIARFFIDPEGRSVGFFTGWATLLSGVGLAGVTIIFLTLNIVLRGSLSRRGTRPTPGRGANLVFILQLLVAICAIAAPMLTARQYVDGGQASGVSLEYGLILLWAAAYVGILGNLLGTLTAWAGEKLRGRDYLSYLMFAFFVGLGLAVGNLLSLN